MQPTLSMLATFMQADKVKKLSFKLMQKLPTSRNKYKKKDIYHECSQFNPICKNNKSFVELYEVHR